MTTILKGAPVAQAISDESQVLVAKLKEQGITPTLAILRVGEREDDLSYERGAMKRCESVGVAVRNVILPADTEQSTMIQTIDNLNNDSTIHGILMFRPLPEQLDEKECCEAISPAKDVDSATIASLAGVFTDTVRGFPPCTPQACMEILHYYDIPIKGSKVAVLGRSLIVGKPVAMLLLAEGATPVICHTKTPNTSTITQQADIVIAAVGRPKNFSEEYFTQNQVVIDVGINWDEENQKLCGDVDYFNVEKIVRAITPVPGGVGSVTTAVLVKHVIEAAQRTL